MYTYNFCSLTYRPMEQISHILLDAHWYEEYSPKNQRSMFYTSEENDVIHNKT